MMEDLRLSIVKTGPNDLGIYRQVVPHNGIYEVQVDKCMAGTYALLLGNRVVGHFSKHDWSRSYRTIYYDHVHDDLWSVIDR